ncbi:hypothetical protein LJR143_002952 [Pseudoxanthomonas sp. LjRoot143]|uniref:hypothetical protein n=1 Tax=unclassified Pseudoxanthomonas TaxID=2645906 RepID=UPI00177BD9E7|nr:hypothetical protein [Pseudoxanthomonas sp. PXM01]MBD9470039.1 hypothetical protein [Pseudoxanthomonas sp. PXM01]
MIAQTLPQRNGTVATDNPHVIKLSRDSSDACWRDLVKALFSSTFERMRDFDGLVFFWSLRARRMLRAHTRLRKNGGDETRV